ncbi:MAG: hypothetical protein ACOVP4_08780 [Bacteriovoracaceae bacterium]
MKVFFILGTVFFILDAQASYFATHCSNARGTVKWETGHNSNTIRISYYGSEGQEELHLKINEVKIELKDKIILSSSESRCPNPMISKTEIYSGKVLITPAKESPEVFGGLIYGDKIEAHVICEYHMNSRGHCPPTEN